MIRTSTPSETTKGVIRWLFGADPLLFYRQETFGMGKGVYARYIT